MLDGKVILVTGGTGSFGQKFTEIVLERYKPNAQQGSIYGSRT